MQFAKSPPSDSVLPALNSVADSWLPAPCVAITDREDISESEDQRYSDPRPERSHSVVVITSPVRVCRSVASPESRFLRRYSTWSETLDSNTPPVSVPGTPTHGRRPKTNRSAPRHRELRSARRTGPRIQRPISSEEPWDRCSWLISLFSQRILTCPWPLQEQSLPSCHARSDAESVLPDFFLPPAVSSPRASPKIESPLATVNGCYVPNESTAFTQNAEFEAFELPPLSYNATPSGFPRFPLVEESTPMSPATPSIPAEAGQENEPMKDPQSSECDDFQNRHLDFPFIELQPEETPASITSEGLLALPWEVCRDGIFQFLELRDILRLRLLSTEFRVAINSRIPSVQQNSSDNAETLSDDWKHLWEANELLTDSALSPSHFMQRPLSFFDPPTDAGDCPPLSDKIRLGSWWNSLTSAEEMNLTRMLAGNRLKSMDVEPGFYECPCTVCTNIRLRHSTQDRHPLRLGLDAVSLQPLPRSPPSPFILDGLLSPSMQTVSIASDLLSSPSVSFVSSRRPFSAYRPEDNLRPSTRTSARDFLSPGTPTVPRNEWRLENTRPYSAGARIADPLDASPWSLRRPPQIPLSQLIPETSEWSQQSSMLQTQQHIQRQMLSPITRSASQMSDFRQSPLSHVSLVSQEDTPLLRRMPAGISLMDSVSPRLLHRDPVLSQHLSERLSEDSGVDTSSPERSTERNEQPLRIVVTPETLERQRFTEGMTEREFMARARCGYLASFEDDYHAQLRIAKRHACARVWSATRLMLICRATLESVDLGELPSCCNTICDDGATLPEFPIDLRQQRNYFVFPELKKLRFGPTIDCRFIVPLLDFCQYPKLNAVEILGLTIKYENQAPQFGIQPTMVFGPQHIFNMSTDGGTRPLWLPALYNGTTDESLRLNGRGVYVSREYHYEGWFKEGRNDGFGRMRSKCGELYEGSWKNGSRHGHGTVIQRDGKRLEGTWVHDILQGRGLTEFANGIRYEGEWSHGVLEGWGVVSKDKQLLAIGQFSEGRPHGWMVCRNSFYATDKSAFDELHVNPPEPEMSDSPKRSLSFLDVRSLADEELQSDDESFEPQEDFLCELDSLLPPAASNPWQPEAKRPSPVLELTQKHGWMAVWRYLYSPPEQHAASINLLLDPPPLSDVLLLNPNLDRQACGVVQHSQRRKSLRASGGVDILDIPAWVEELASSLDTGD